MMPPSPDINSLARLMAPLSNNPRSRKTQFTQEEIASRQSQLIAWINDLIRQGRVQASPSDTKTFQSLDSLHKGLKKDSCQPVDDLIIALHQRLFDNLARDPGHTKDLELANIENTSGIFGTAIAENKLNYLLNLAESYASAKKDPGRAICDRAMMGIAQTLKSADELKDHTLSRLYNFLDAKLATRFFGVLGRNDDAYGACILSSLALIDQKAAEPRLLEIALNRKNYHQDCHKEAVDYFDGSEQDLLPESDRIILQFLNDSISSLTKSDQKQINAGVAKFNSLDSYDLKNSALDIAKLREALDDIEERASYRGINKRLSNLRTALRLANKANRQAAKQSLKPKLVNQYFDPKDLATKLYESRRLVDNTTNVVTLDRSIDDDVDLSLLDS